MITISIVLSVMCGAGVCGCMIYGIAQDVKTYKNFQKELDKYGLK